MVGDKTETPVVTEAVIRQLTAEWVQGRGRSSNPDKLMSHPAFQEIVGMGTKAVPFILRVLKEKPSLLVWVLPRITRENPVPPAAAGNIPEMTRAWIEWGESRKYL